MTASDIRKHITLIESLTENDAPDEDARHGMEAFGLAADDLVDGYVVLYHGTVKPTKTLKKGEIFFMTPSEEEAWDYARMRQHQTGKKGVVQTIRVNPNDVFWNTGSGEVEFSQGGKIENGVLFPARKKKKASAKPEKHSTEYRGVKPGTVLPTTGMKVLDVVIHPTGWAQFLIHNDGKNIWCDADTVIDYEFSENGK